MTLLPVDLALIVLFSFGVGMASTAVLIGWWLEHRINHGDFK